MSEKNRECPKCRENGHDKDKNHLWLMSDGKKWTCRKKEYHSDGEIYYEVNGEHYVPSGDICSVFSSTPSVSRILYDVGEEYRGILPATYKKYDVRCEKGRAGEILSLVHNLYESGTDQIVTQKIRKLPKEFFTAEKTKGRAIQFFGQSVFKRAKRLLITEGELDALSAYQMLEKYRVAVVSLPTGANVKALIDNFEYLKGFKEVYACMDQDKAGSGVSRDIANMLPLCKFLKLSEKDANDMLQKGKVPEFISAFFDAEVYRPDTIVRVSSIIEDVMKKPTIGRPWPWKTLTDVTYGRRGGEGLFLGAGVKCGKSEFINQVIAFDCYNKDPIAVIKFEETNSNTIKRVAGKLDGTFYHKPGLSYNEATLRSTALSLDPYLYLYPPFGKARWGNLKDFIRWCVMSGCQTIIIDPITKITNGLTPSETETELRLFADELACMAQDMNFFYIVTCHLKAPSSGPPHERGGKVETYQFRGSRAMAENCFYFLGIQRNKDPDLSETERNTSTLVLLEDRAFGNVCKFPVYYDKVTQAYIEPTLSF